MNILAYTLISGILGIIGQLLLKKAMLAIGPLVLRPDALPGIATALVFNPLVIAGLAVTVSGTFFWLIALSRADLSYAYPLTSINYLLILLASWLIFGERVTLTRVIGVVAICIGVWAISRTHDRAAPADERPASTPTRASLGDTGT